MNLSVYAHPERLLIATWTVDDGTPVLRGYKELHPRTTIDLRNFDVENVHVVLHSSNVLLHWVPVDVGEDLSTRLQFERTSWFDVDEYQALSTSAFQTVIDGNFHQLHACAQADASVIAYRNAIASEQTPTSVDLDLDVQAALLTTKPQPSSWLLLGRRGEMWHAFIIGVEHRPIAYAAFLHDNAQSHQSMIIRLLQAMSHRYEFDVRAIMLFGDVLTANEVVAIRDAFSTSAIRVARLQPFKLIRSMLDEATEQRLLKRAHIVAPLAGSMLLERRLETT